MRAFVQGDMRATEFGEQKEKCSGSGNGFGSVQGHCSQIQFFSWETCYSLRSRGLRCWRRQRRLPPGDPAIEASQQYRCQCEQRGLHERAAVGAHREFDDQEDRRADDGADTYASTSKQIVHRLAASVRADT